MREKPTEATDLEKLIFEKIGLYIQSGKAAEVADNYYKPKLEEIEKKFHIYKSECLAIINELKAENEALKNGMIEIKRKYLLSIKLKAEIDELLKPKKDESERI